MSFKREGFWVPESSMIFSEQGVANCCEFNGPAFSWLLESWQDARESAEAVNARRSSHWAGADKGLGLAARPVNRRLDSRRGGGRGGAAQPGPATGRTKSPRRPWRSPRFRRPRQLLDRVSL